MKEEEKISATEKEKRTWSVKHEGHLNKNNMIFKDKKYLKLYENLKEVDDSIKKGYSSSNKE